MNLLNWLKEERTDVLNELWLRADQIRRTQVGNNVFLRGLMEISNCCVRQCQYCGLRAANRELSRYRMTVEEIIHCARAAVDFGYGTVVLQAGEDPGITREWMENVIKLIKSECGLAITLSLGERSIADLAAWRQAGADRYLLRFETSDRKLFQRIHPSLDPQGNLETDRVFLLKELRRLGYEVGSGVMVGIPGQAYQTLVADLELFRELDLDMVGIGPFIPHPATPLGKTPLPNGEDQVPNTELMTYKMLALARLVVPRANIPSTTALATLNLANGRELGLQRGANILMPNITPLRYRVHYEIYPAKACINETADQCHGCMRRRIESIGRKIGQGPGGARDRDS
jgi:biotin synthase